MPKNSNFMFHLEQWESLSTLSNEQLGALLRAIFSYHMEEAVPDMDVITKALFLMMKPRFDYQAKKYAEIVEKKREGGRKSSVVRGIKTMLDEMDENEDSSNEMKTLQKKRRLFK